MINFKQGNKPGRKRVEMAVLKAGDVLISRKHHLKKGDISEIQGMVVSINKVWGHDNRYRVRIKISKESPCLFDFASFNVYSRDGENFYFYCKDGEFEILQKAETMA